MERRHVMNHRSLDIAHTFGKEDNYGDIDFEAYAKDDAFNIELWRANGRDRDGYDQSEHADIDLNEEELRELIILGTLWLEKRAQERGA